MTREFLNETQERFLKGVLTKLPIEKIAELYLFQPIKQGGVESGVAVIASVPEAPPVAESEPGDAGAVAAQDSIDAGAVAARDSTDAGAAAELEVLDHAGAGAELGVVEESGDAKADADAEVVEAEAEADVDAELTATDEAIAGDDVESLEHGEIRAPGESVVASTAAEELETLDDSGAGAELGVVDDEGADAEADAAADADTGTASVDLAEAFDDELADVEPEPIDAGEEYPSQVASRYTVYSANYRLVLKGPDRGKWALDVKAEADAPLITLETVVRGVQQRSGDVEPPRRYDQAELREILRLPADTPAPAAGAPPTP